MRRRGKLPPLVRQTNPRSGATGRSRVTRASTRTLGRVPTRVTAQEKPRVHQFRHRSSLVAVARAARSAGVRPCSGGFVHWVWGRGAARRGGTNRSGCVDTPVGAARLTRRQVLAFDGPRRRGNSRGMRSIRSERGLLRGCSGPAGPAGHVCMRPPLDPFRLGAAAPVSSCTP